MWSKERSPVNYKKHAHIIPGYLWFVTNAKVNTTKYLDAIFFFPVFAYIMNTITGFLFFVFFIAEPFSFYAFGTFVDRWRKPVVDGNSLAWLMNWLDCLTSCHLLYCPTGE